MALQTFTWTPDLSTRGRPRVLMNKAQFGDGYTQRIKRGAVVGGAVKNVFQDWSLQFVICPLATAQAIHDFLSARGGVEKFYWTPPTPGNVQAVFVCETWDWVHNVGGQIMGVSAEFTEEMPV